MKSEAKPIQSSCGCGETWSLTEWPELPLVGRYLAGREGWIELRTCVCGSTLAVRADALGPAPGPEPRLSTTFRAQA